MTESERKREKREITQTGNSFKASFEGREGRAMTKSERKREKKETTLTGNSFKASLKARGKAVTR